MFKSAATKIAHNTTIPALAGHSDLRPLQDLITAEKTVLASLQKLKVDLAKAADALRIWGLGEGDDLGDVLAASATVLAHFATALSTYSSLHHAVRDNMKSVRTREEALDDLRRRRRRVGSSAEAAERKLHKMSPEHKNLGAQTDILNKLRDEIRAIDGDIVRDEADLGDYKRKCTKDWMGLKFGGLVECCEKGVIVGDIGRRIIQSIPEDVTHPGLPRAYYNAHSRVGDLVDEAQRAVSQVAFSGNPSGQPPISQPPAPEVSAQSPFLPTPSLGSELTLGQNMYSPPPGPPPPHRRASVDELGMHAPPAHMPPQFSSLPKSKEREPVPMPSSAATMSIPLPPPLTSPYDDGVVRTEENQSLMASIADALSHTQHGFTLEEANSFGHASPDEPVPKYEPLPRDMSRSPRSEPHAPIMNGHVNLPARTEEREGTRRTARRSTSPPCLPPGAAPAAVRAWDDRMGQGEDGTHSGRPASSSTDVPSQRRTSSSERDGEEEDGLAYDRDSRSFKDGGGGGGGKHGEEDASLSESGGDLSANATTYEGATAIRRSASGAPPLSRAASQWRIPRVPPPAMDADPNDIQQPYAHERQSVYGSGTDARGDEELRTEESADEKELNAAAAREVSREMDALMFTAIAPSTSSGYSTPRPPPPGYVSPLSARSPPIPPQSPAVGGRTPQNSTPPSPILPPNPPFANRGRPPIIEARYPGHASSESVGRIPAPVPTVVSPTPPRPTSPVYRSPPPEYPCPTPPFSSPLMTNSTSSLNGGGASPGGGPRTITAAAFRRQQMRSASGEPGPADTSPLALRKPSGSPVPRQGGPTGVNKELPRARLAVANPGASDDSEPVEELEYGGESAGYEAGRYVSNLDVGR